MVTQCSNVTLAQKSDVPISFSNSICTNTFSDFYVYKQHCIFRVRATRRVRVRATGKAALGSSVKGKTDVRHIVRALRRLSLRVTGKIV